MTPWDRYRQANERLDEIRRTMASILEDRTALANELRTGLQSARRVTRERESRLLDVGSDIGTHALALAPTAHELAAARSDVGTDLASLQAAVADLDDMLNRQDHLLVLAETPTQGWRRLLAPAEGARRLFAHRAGPAGPPLRPGAPGTLGQTTLTQHAPGTTVPTQRRPPPTND